MRNLAIAYGNNRQAKKWVNKTIRFDDLKERLKVTIRTPESAEEYAKMSKAQRDAAKDHGGFVAGVLIGGRRRIPWRSVLWSLLTVTASQRSSWITMKQPVHIHPCFIPRIAIRRRIQERVWSFL